MMNAEEQQNLLELAQVTRRLFPEGKYHFLIAVMTLIPETLREGYAEIRDTTVMSCCVESNGQIIDYLRDRPVESEMIRLFPQ